MIARMNDVSFEGVERVEREVEVLDEGRRLFAEDAAEQFAFNAADFDAETPLCYFDARWHDPATGQFLTTDPTECDIAEHSNYYSHAAANPTNHVDPSGL